MDALLICDGRSCRKRTRNYRLLPDNSLIAAPIGHGSKATNAGLWSAVTGGDPVLTLGDDDTPNVRSVVFSPDGSRVAACSEDQSTRVWDATTGLLLHTLLAPVNQVATTPLPPSPPSPSPLPSPRGSDSSPPLSQPVVPTERTEFSPLGQQHPPFVHRSVSATEPVCAPLTEDRHSRPIDLPDRSYVPSLPAPDEITDDMFTPAPFGKLEDLLPRPPPPKPTQPPTDPASKPIPVPLQSNTISLLTPRGKETLWAPSPVPHCEPRAW